MAKQTQQAKRLATVQTDAGKVSYWEHGEEVYRLSEYEPVQFDIYGLPLGARWETNRFHWDDFKAVVLPAEPSTPCTTCIEHAYGTTTRLSFQIKVF
jgi:hypothetical protein